MKINKKILTSLAVFIALILGLVFLVIFPLIEEIKKGSEEFQEIKKDSVLIEIKAENIEEIKQDYQNFESSLGEINKLFIDFNIPLDFVKFLEATALDSNLLIDISSVSAEEIKTDPWKSLSFQTNLKGSTIDFLRYIQKMELSPYLIEITDLSIRKKTEQEEGILFLSIKVYAK